MQQVLWLLACRLCRRCCRFSLTPVFSSLALRVFGVCCVCVCVFFWSSTHVSFVLCGKIVTFGFVQHYRFSREFAPFR